jgi:hypothetical protein
MNGLPVAANNMETSVSYQENAKRLLANKGSLLFCNRLYAPGQYESDVPYATEDLKGTICCHY